MVEGTGPHDTVHETVAAIRAGRTSAVAVARAALTRIAAYKQRDPHVWISRFPDAQVEAAAQAIDARLASGEDLPLAGVPFAVKDNIDVAGLPTTAACPDFAYQPAAHAAVVQRLIDAGALCLGKTNLDQFATGLNGTRSPYGAPRCVLNPDYISGGSSSGSAVSVAAGLVAFALGTDTAGSGRVPAAFNGIVGLKPSKGRWSTTGLVPACRSLDCISVFTRGARDAALIDRVVAGFDAVDVFSQLPHDRVLGRRIGVPLPANRVWFGDGEAERLYDAALLRLAELGYQLCDVDIAPLLEAAELLYQGPWVAERTAALADLLRDRPGVINPVVRGIVAAGMEMSAVDAFRGQYRLAAMHRAAEPLWEGIDALALPTAPTIYTIAAMQADPVVLNSHLGTYTNFVNLLDLAAVAVPAGQRGNGTGFGISFVAPRDSDRALLGMAGQWLDEDGADAAPAFAPALVDLAVVGAHLRGMPLHWQLTARNAELIAETHTAPTYRLYAMADSVPPKPALIHDAAGGAAIAVEVYRMDMAAFGSFVADVPQPLAIGTVTLADGSCVKGFVAEPRAIEGARDITGSGGWRVYLERSGL